MSITITTPTKEELENMFEQGKVVNRLNPELAEALKEQGWVIDDYHIEKIYKGYPIVIEFCLGDFCTYPCSKVGHWLLEKKYPAPTLMEALIHSIKIESRIDNGEHWTGEDR